MCQREDGPGKPVQRDVIEGIIGRTESAVAQSRNTQLLDTILKLGLRESSSYLEVGPGRTRTALMAAMMGLSVVLFDNNDDVISYQESIFLDHEGDIQRAGGHFRIERLDAILAEQCGEYNKYGNTFDCIVCVNFSAQNDDLGELVGHLRHWGREEFVLFTCMWKVPVPEVPDLIVEAFCEDARLNLIRFAVLHTGVFTSESYPDLCNGIIANVSKRL